MAVTWVGAVASCGGEAPAETSGSAGPASSSAAEGSGGGAATTSASSGSTASGAGGAGTGGGDGGGGGGGGSGSGGGGGGTASDPAEPLFSGSQISSFDIKLTPDAVNQLNADPKTYVMADVDVVTGNTMITLSAVGVRLKGNYGSFRTLDQKAGFLLDFNKFTKGQKLFDMGKLALNNMVQDKSMIHERLGYVLFRDGDVPAPRSGYATVRVNGELYGLYTTVEPTGNGPFLKHWFGSNDGNLYEGAYGSDLVDGLIPSFDQDNGKDVNFADLQALSDALDAMTDPQTFVADVSKLIDLDRYVAFAATEIFMGHWDGYAWTKNNFYVYRRPDDGRWTFIPWGIDQTFYEYLEPFGGQGRLEQMCNASIECRKKLGKAFEAVVARAAQLDLVGQAGQIKNLIWNDLVQDPRKETDEGTAAYEIEATIQFLLNRPADLQAGLVCADPTSVDEDGDGTPGCGIDCDDHNPSVHPGAPELCNLADDNCNGVWDDDPKCPPCVQQQAPGGGKLAFCFIEKTWFDAEADCVAQGGHLASIHDGAAQDQISASAFGIFAGDWWIGLTDEAQEGSFAWTDGKPFDFDGWAGGEPNNSGGNENCAHLTLWGGGGAWNDNYCFHHMPYVCSLK